jgi:hypothetical protein
VFDPGGLFGLPYRWKASAGLANDFRYQLSRYGIRVAKPVVKLAKVMMFGEG